ncbi:NAD(P)H-binding protein [Actinoplanes sp. NPDC048967]|uniref:NmrA family NAD(P)-binding protein n=1 Tax=Actinoplanes sp. NPDC048967 TaxID=3155269 RepID=UPI0033FA2972
MTIAVTAATGHVGSRAVQVLIQAGVRPTVLIRDPAKLPAEVRDRVDVLPGDLRDAAYVTEATKGADALLWVVPESFTADDPVAEMTAIAANGAAAIAANGIGRTVLISSVGAERRHGAGMIDGLARAEELLGGAGPVCTLRCGYYFTNLLGSLEELRAGTLTTTRPADAPMPWVDPRDVGEVAAARLLSEQWSSSFVQAVHGPADLSWLEVAEIVGAALGRKLSVQVITDDELRGALHGAGLTPGVVEGIVGMTAGLRDDFVPEQSRSFVSTTPTTLAAWAAQHLRLP